MLQLLQRSVRRVNLPNWFLTKRRREQTRVARISTILNLHKIQLISVLRILGSWLRRRTTRRLQLCSLKRHCRIMWNMGKTGHCWPGIMWTECLRRRIHLSVLPISKTTWTSCQALMCARLLRVKSGQTVS